MRRVAAALAIVALAACGTVRDPLSGAEPGSAVPWSEVGAGWYLVLYEGPASGTGLLAVDPAGVTYLLHTWDKAAPPVELLDWSGRQEVLVLTPYEGYFRAELIDLQDGSEMPVCSLCWEAIGAAGSPEASFSNHDDDLVVYLNDAYAERLQVRNRAGEVTGTLYRQLFTDAYWALAWIETPDGEGIVVAHLDGLSLVDRRGVVVADLWLPPGERCAPVRWWDEGMVLAACRGRSLEAVHDFYNRLYLIPIDGSAGAPLTALPAEPPAVGDFGYADAWRVGEGIIVQWRGECAASRVEWLDQGGLLLPGAAAGSAVAGVQEGTVVLRTWEGCDESAGELVSVAPDGAVEVLVPAPAEGLGVRSAIGVD